MTERRDPVPDEPAPDSPRALAEARELAARGPDAARWRRITTLASILSPAGVDLLDEALRDWPDALRSAPPSWGAPLPPISDEPYRPPALRIARRLEIVHQPLTARDLRLLLTCEHVRRLRALVLFDNALDRSCIDAVSELDLPALRELSIGGRDLDDDGARVLAGARALSAVVTLALPQNALSPASARALATAALTELAALELPENRIGDDGLAALARGPLAAQLRSLDLADNDVGPAGLIALSAADLTRLARLRLALNHGGDDGVAALASSSARLEDVNLSENRITAGGVRALVQGHAFARLSSLSLAYNPLGAEGASTIAGAALPELRALDLSGTRIGVAGALAIVQAPQLALRSLYLQDLGIDDDGARQLLACDALGRLDAVDLRGNSISAPLVQAIRARLR